MKIGEVAQRSGLSIDTIRYYEKRGLLPEAFRGPAGQRSYDASILHWIDFLKRMKASGMPLKEIAAYAVLWQQGAGTASERRRLLEQHGKRIAARIDELQSCLLVIDDKVLDLIELEKG